MRNGTRKLPDSGKIGPQGAAMLGISRGRGEVSGWQR